MHGMDGNIMKKGMILKLKNATLESLSENKVTFIGELKGYLQRLTWTVADTETYNGLKLLDVNEKYNIYNDTVGKVLKNPLLPSKHLVVQPTQFCFCCFKF